jgi:hypothetical protein
MSTLKRIWIPLAATALAMAAIPAQAEEMRFSAKLTGAAQLPEPTKSTAEGEMTLVVAPGGAKVSYTLTVKNITNPSGADIHLGLETANGPSVIKLFPIRGATAKKGPFSGVLAEGTFTAADLVGPLQGGSLADLIEEFGEGQAYVNVHTNDGVAPDDTGPGDYHFGEIRGQIK